ncbi:MAG TPA: hypothetical protein VM597_22690 [Gemmataceae bacterium]|nr:hypothetical protein [Gemmataceae bacterium]
MRVAALRLFLTSLRPALEAAGDPGPGRSAVTAAAAALEPFDDLALDEFAAFLARADEYRRTGAVRVPGAADRAGGQLLEAAAMVSAVRNELGRPGAVADLESGRTAVADAVKQLAADAGLAVTLKADPKWASTLIARSRVAPLVAQIRALAGQITSPDAYADEAARQTMTQLEAEMAGVDLKALAAEFGAKATARAKPDKVLADVLAKVTGHKPGRAKAVKKPSVDPALVAEHSGRLAGLIARSAGPDGLSGADIEAELSRLGQLAKPALFAVVTAARVEGAKASESTAALLQRVRNRLTAVQRARERAEV